MKIEHELEPGNFKEKKILCKIGYIITLVPLIFGYVYILLNWFKSDWLVYITFRELIIAIIILALGLFLSILGGCKIKTKIKPMRPL